MDGSNLTLFANLPRQSNHDFNSFEKRISNLRKKIYSNIGQLISAITRNYEIYFSQLETRYSIEEHLYCGVITNTTHFPRSEQELVSSRAFIYNVMNPCEILLPGGSIAPSPLETGFISQIHPGNLLYNMNASPMIPDGCRIAGSIENLPRLEIYVGDSEVLSLLGTKFSLVPNLKLEHFIGRQIPYHLAEQKTTQETFRF